MASVTYQHVTKRFGDVVAIQDLNIHVQDKGFLVLVGPSGCGKTTALRLLAGLEEISGGEIRIGDRVVNELPPKERDIAMVFQSYALYPHMSVFDNMAFGLKLRRLPKEEIKKRVEQAAELLGIEMLLERKPRQLSGGQRQRVAVGRAIVREPKVFLFDEPLSNLDAKLRVQTRAEISKLHHRLATTFIYVTHDQTEAMTMASQIAVLKGGELQQLDTPQRLYDFPDNVFVGGFIGSPAMNFFPGKLERVNGGTRVRRRRLQCASSGLPAGDVRQAPGQAGDSRDSPGRCPRPDLRASGDHSGAGGLQGRRHRADGQRGLRLSGGRPSVLCRTRRPPNIVSHRSAGPGGAQRRSPASVRDRRRSARHSLNRPRQTEARPGSDPGSDTRKGGEVTDSRTQT